MVSKPRGQRPAPAIATVAEYVNHWRGIKLSCLGAAHLDTVTRLLKSAVGNRTNPVHNTIVRPGGVANNIACCLARLGTTATLYCPPPPLPVKLQLDELGVRQFDIGDSAHNCGYTAVLRPDGELEIGLADMDEYDRIEPGMLPRDFPRGKKGTLIIDASFSANMSRHVASKARAKGWAVVGAGTSPAKVMRLSDIEFDLFVLNEAEARVFAGKANATSLARKIARRTKGWVAITQGSEGACLVTDDGKIIAAKPNRPKKTSPTDTTGAGDAFTAALAAARLACLDGIGTPRQALEIAVAAGSAAASDA